MKWKVGLLIIFLVLGFWRIRVARAIDCSLSETDYNKLELCKNDLVNEVNLLTAGIEPNEEEIKRLDSRIKSLQTSINVAIAKQKQLEKEVADREEKLAEHYVLFGKKIRELYKSLRGSSLLVQMLSTVGAGQINREIAYKGTASNVDKQLIMGLSDDILSLETDKKNLDEQRSKLAILQTIVNKQAEFLKGEVAKANKYRDELLGKIAALSARQQEILGEKQGTFQTTVGDVPLADDPNSRPDYNPGFSPAFAAFSFGAPHFKGMSQYGAFGRAKAGQSAEQILQAYYGGVEIKNDYSTERQIKVCDRWHYESGKMICDYFFPTVDIETYVKRIYEVPGSWGDEGGMEALKAQAIAARSYALAYTDDGRGWICDSQDCQVYKNSNKGGKWEEAANATRGRVLVANGKPFKSMFASTSGGYQFGYTDSYTGYSTNGFWDTPSGRGGWTNQAFEKTAGSPWFYKGWYKSRSGVSCGRSHPWLNGEEMADILNAWTVLVKNGQSDDRIVPLGGCSGGNPYSISELRDRAAGMGGGYSNVTGVSVSYSDGGYTANVHLDTNKGGVDMSGDDFKKAFNLRAPGWISLKSRLFNIEKK